MQIVYHFPTVVSHSFKAKYDRIQWRNDEREFGLWCQGKTGYPIVDAGMRQLNETGFMHNRIRMIVAGFLCKHLLIDWRWGESCFAQKLNDYDLAANNGNWQWATGSGCDAAPYFRVFNPATQAEKFDENDNAIGVMEKLLAHEHGELHRAFSVFIFNDKGELLLQQRAADKYHGGGLWTNTCCSHPQWDEDVRESAVERLNYEMGLKCPLKVVYSFIYHAPVENNLTEHELDYVFIGYSNQNPILNTHETQDYKWMNTDEILLDLETNPTHYTVWFRQAFPELLFKINK